MATIRHRIILSAVLTFTLGLRADPPAESVHDSSTRQSFEQFRKGIIGDYKAFRKTIIDHYADFLEGEWHPYEKYNGEKRDEKPKPRQEPRADMPENGSSAGNSKVISIPAAPACVPASELSAPISGMYESQVASPYDTFEFYTIPVRVPHKCFSIDDRLYTSADYASQWRSLQRENVAEFLLPELQRVARSMGLNDYLTYRLIQSYIDARFPETDSSSRFAVVHYLLANGGYDARIATTGEGVPLLLLACKQTIYSRAYMMVDGRKYYVFEPEGVDLAKVYDIRTCKLPEGGTPGRSMDLRLDALQLPDRPKAFEFECDPIHLKGVVNENIMPLLYRYPQIPVEDVALSNVQPGLRTDLVRQMRAQLSDMTGDEAVAALLAFMHSVFDYATDEDFHGFEKSYFLEETLYYPKNDCEDRAIFYTWFLWNALGREAQLLSFPGHEAAAVRMDEPVDGVGYNSDEVMYYISDPTFIGSRTGMIMPDYRNTLPKIDHTFK